MLAITPVFVTAAQAAAPLGVGKAEIGIYGVTNIPLEQDDADPAPLYGARARVKLLPFFSLEGSITFLESADGEITIGGETVTLEAPEMTTYALNVLIPAGRAPGFSIYATGGVGWTSIEFPGGVKLEEETTYNLGAGATIGVPIMSFPITVDIGSRLFYIDLEEGDARKNLGILAGANFPLN
jgi:hypothetical protein